MSKDEIRKNEMAKNVFWKDQAVIACLVFLMVFLLTAWGLWYFLYQQVGYSVGIPAYFNFMQPYQLLYKYVLPLFASVMALFHLFIAFFAYKRDRLVSYILVGGTAFLSLLVVVTGIYYMSSYM
ncbi:MAG TPA: hypothetical protein PLH65_01730 [bacterium]|nr:hypothetical protein [bacterium]